MWNIFFGKKQLASGTGFFKVENETVIPLDKINGNGSINSCIETLGYPLNHVRVLHRFDSDKIVCLGVRILSRQPVFVLAKAPETKISYQDVKKELNRVDWDFEYSNLNIPDILEEGVTMENLGLAFLQTVIDLTEDSENVYISNRLGMYLQFESGLLKAFTSTSWDNSATKWLSGLNPGMVKAMTAEARQYHQNEFEAMEEVNKQADSILNIPQALNNEFIRLHLNKHGNVNFYNLLIAHYTKNCSLKDFQYMNKGRFQTINAKTLKVDNFIYFFNGSGELESVVRI